MFRRRRAEDPFAGFSDVHEIGQGAFATVYRAVDTASGSPVALKVLHGAGNRRFDDHVLEQEARALGAASDHPHVVTLHRAVLRDDGYPMLVLELCGGSLADRLAATGPLPVAEAIAIAVKLAGALESAHRAGVLHRDLKPSNVLTTVYGEPVLADFGIAGLREATAGGSQLSGLTVHHASPETLLGEPASVASDVYGLASTLYELLDGHAPFYVTAGEDPADVQRRIITDLPPRLEAPGTSPALRDLLRRALSKDPVTRPASALTFAQELREIERAAGRQPTPCRVDGLATVPPLPPRAERAAVLGQAAATTGVGDLGLEARRLDDVEPADRALPDAPAAAPPSFLPGRAAPLLRTGPPERGDDVRGGPHVADGGADAPGGGSTSAGRAPTERPGEPRRSIAPELRGFGEAEDDPAGDTPPPESPGG